jgi:RimJ/RimL family protein N-acetyltransferase
MHLVKITNRQQIEQFLRKDSPLHVYEIGDLDPFFWPATTWYGVEGRQGELQALALIYTVSDSVTLVALGRDDQDAASRKLIDSILAELPDRFYAHLNPALLQQFSRSWKSERVIEGIKMHLADSRRPAQEDTSDVQQLLPADLPEVLDFYATAYPGNWFDARMLETGQYFGVRRGNRLVSVAGVHVFSRQYQVAALGNIATLPEQRRMGLARRATARLCQSLLEAHVETIGLNVHKDNRAAFICYERLGFETVCPYVEVQYSRT